MKHIAIILISVSLQAIDVCHSYPAFIEAQSKAMTDDATRSGILLRVIELAFNDCYEDMPEKQKGWYRDKYVQAWEYNTKIKQGATK